MAILPGYRDIIDLLKKGSTLEAQEKIVELREVALEIQEENLVLKQEIKELQDKLRVRDEVTYEKPYYWVMKDAEKDGPFCQHCFDKERLLIRLQAKGPGRWFCHSCKGAFYDASYKPPSPGIASSRYRII